MDLFQLQNSEFSFNFAIRNFLLCCSSFWKYLLIIINLDTENFQNIL